MNVMSTTELCDVINNLLKSKPKHLPTDLGVAWLKCIKHVTKSPCFSAPGNSVVCVYVDCGDLNKHTTHRISNRLFVKLNINTRRCETLHMNLCY